MTNTAAVKVGDIFKDTWGYGQVNVSYYQVIAVAAKTVQLQQIGKQVVSYDHQTMQGSCIPVPGRIVGRKPFRRTPGVEDGSVYVATSSFSCAFLHTPVATADGSLAFAPDYFSNCN